MTAAQLLALNASLQILVSSILGVLMLVPLQPWARGWGQILRSKGVTSTHLDWLMLAFMQTTAAFLLDRWPIPSDVAWTAAWLLVFGGWINAVPYLLRSFGINAFVLAGPLHQRLWASVAGLSVLALVVGWGLILYHQVTT